MEQTPKKNELMRRYELNQEGKMAFLAWEERASGELVFNHTFVPPELRGRNLAAILTEHALDDARAQGRKVVPQCSYVAAYMERNRNYDDLRAGGVPLAGSK